MRRGLTPCPADIYRRFQGPTATARHLVEPVLQLFRDGFTVHLTLAVDDATAALRLFGHEIKQLLGISVASTPRIAS